MSYKHLTIHERSHIYMLKSIGYSQQNIALSLKRSRGTISREIKRNSGLRGYRFKQAERKAVERRYSASAQPRRMTPEFTSKIIGFLQLQWSPEQIAGRLKQEGVKISHETIYRMVWANKKRGGTLYKNLRHRGKKYAYRGNKHAGRGLIPHRVDISKRPAIVETKRRFGDWEADTIIGAQHKGAIVSLVERKSKITLFAGIKEKTAAATAAAINRLLQQIPRSKRKTITFDNGKEFAHHLSIAHNLSVQCFFARPYHSWERGLNEHTNGLLRQYLPKSTDFTDLDDDVLRKIQDRLNDRPRKVLNYRTPREVFAVRGFSNFVALGC